MTNSSAFAAEETALAPARLAGEVARTTAQCRMFADGIEEGSWMDVIIDTAGSNAKPVARPDLRRMQLPIGPVLVFAASNFPFAFSVAGGDSASARRWTKPAYPRVRLLWCTVRMSV